MKLQATRIAYSGNREFRRVVTLDGALFEKSGTMSGGGSKPRGGKMGTSIRVATVSAKAIRDAENELSGLSDKLNSLRQKAADAVRKCQTLEKKLGHLEMELAKSQKEVLIHFKYGVYLLYLELWVIHNYSFAQIESLHSQHSYLEKQLGSLEAAAQPKEDELDRLEVLEKVTAAEEKEIDRLIQESKQLKEMVCPIGL